MKIKYMLKYSDGGTSTHTVRVPSYNFLVTSIERDMNYSQAEYIQIVDWEVLLVG